MERRDEVLPYVRHLKGVIKKEYCKSVLQKRGFHKAEEKKAITSATNEPSEQRIEHAVLEVGDNEHKY